MSEIKITKSNFDEVKNSSLPVLIDFFATWCGPCRLMGPVVSEIADEYEGKAVVGKVNVDEEPELASAFGVASIPTFVVLRNGQVASTRIGAVSKTALEDMLN